MQRHPRNQVAHQVRFILQLQGLHRARQVIQHGAPERLGHFVLIIETHQPIGRAAAQHLGGNGAADAFAAIALENKQIGQLQGVHPRDLATFDQQEAGDIAIHQQQIGAPLRVLPVARQVFVMDVETAVAFDIFLLPVRRLVGVVLVEIADQLGVFGAGLDQFYGGFRHGTLGEKMQGAIVHKTFMQANTLSNLSVC